MVVSPAAGAAETQYVAPPSGMCAPQHRSRCFLCDQEGHFVASCLIRAEMLWFMQQAGRSSTPPAGCNLLALPPVPSAEGTTDDSGAISIN